MFHSLMFQSYGVCYTQAVAFRHVSVNKTSRFLPSVCQGHLKKKFCSIRDSLVFPVL